MTREITNLEDVQLLVDSFYENIRGDELLAPIFNQLIQNRWPEHLSIMYRFWQTVLLDEHTYKGSPFHPHARLDVEEKHFVRWIRIFNETVDKLFYGQKAADAKWRGAKMAEVFQAKIAYHRNSN